MTPHRTPQWPRASSLRCATGPVSSLASGLLFTRVGRGSPRCRNIALRHVVVDGIAIAQAGVAVAAAAGGLHQKTLPGLHLEAARCRRFEFVRGAEPHHEAAASSRPACGEPLWGKARLVESSD